MNIHREVAYRLNPALWMRHVLSIPPRAWQEQFLSVPRGRDVLVLTARQVGKTTVAAAAMAHTALFKPGSLSVVACPAQRQSAELLRKVRDFVLKAGAKLISDNVYGLELANGSRVLALPGSEESIRGLTVDGWIVVDEAAYVLDEMIAALRPMRAQRPEARFVMLSTANTRTDPFWSAWETGGQSWVRIQVTVDLDPTLYNQSYSTKSAARWAKIATSGNSSASRQVVPVSPFTWDRFDDATRPLVYADVMESVKANHHRARCRPHEGSFDCRGRRKSMLAPGLKLLERFEELPQGLLGSARAEALAVVDRLYGG